MAGLPVEHLAKRSHRFLPVTHGVEQICQLHLFSPATRMPLHICAQRFNLLLLSRWLVVQGKVHVPLSPIRQGDAD
jgi:hypothetical protein